jgi:hypothetical protein
VSIFGSSFDIVGGSQYLEPELISIGVIDWWICTQFI